MIHRLLVLLGAFAVFSMSSCSRPMAKTPSYPKLFEGLERSPEMAAHFDQYSTNWGRRLSGCGSTEEVSWLNRIQRSFVVKAAGGDCPNNGRSRKAYCPDSECAAYECYSNGRGCVGTASPCLCPDTDPCNADG
jgi:hypothetical protein